MSDIRIRVGASVDASVDRAFESIAKSSKRAAKASEGSWEKLERDLEREAQKILRAQERAAKGAEREAQRSAKAQERAQVQLTRTTEREAKARARAEAQAAREAERAELRAARETAREEKRLARERQERARDRAAFWFGRHGGRIGIGRRASIGVSGGIAAIYGYGGALASGLARAAGVDTDIAAMAQRGFEQADKAQQLINASPSMTGTSIADRRLASQAVLAQAQQTAVATASDTGDILDAMRAFVGKTGDLETARALIADIARLSKATGTSLEDMGSASAEVANHLGDVPNKAEATLAIMRAVAGQGKLGAVEIRDLSTQMAKLASQAIRFTGGVSGNIAVLGALAQESKLRGGSASATQAATSVMRFAQDLSKPTTMRAWANFGLSAFTDQTHTTLKGPEQIILDALKATHGDQAKLGRLFPNTMSLRAVAGFSAIYTEHGGGAAGLQAVREEFTRLTSAAMTQEEVTRAFNAQMETAQSKAQQFNAQMQAVVEQLSEAALPALEGLAPLLVSATKGLSEWVSELTGSGNRAAVVNAEGIEGQEGKTAALIDASKKTERDKRSGKLLTVYSGQAVDVLQGQGATRARVHGELEGQIYKTEARASEEEATARRLDTRVSDAIVNGVLGLFGGHITTEAEKAAKDRALAEELHQHNVKIISETQKSNDLLRSIYLEVQHGNARIDRPPPPKADTSGSARAEAVP